MVVDFWLLVEKMPSGAGYYYLCVLCGENDFSFPIPLSSFMVNIQK